MSSKQLIMVHKILITINVECTCNTRDAVAVAFSLSFSANDDAIMAYIKRESVDGL